jgi:hypothetical protein
MGVLFFCQAKEETMRAILMLGLALSGMAVQAQTKIEKIIPVQSAQKLELTLDYPELIKVQTWDRKEVMIKGTVSINRGENDDAFDLEIKNAGNMLSVNSILKDKANIPHRLVIRKGDQEYFFKARDFKDPAVQKFLDENGREYTYMTNGIIKEIELEVFVPKGMETRIDAKYGLVEVKNFEAPLTVMAPHGGIDATIASRTTGEVMARTRFGEILTNLDVKFDSKNSLQSHDKWTEISAKTGTGPRYTLESKFGKVYLRKPQS